MNIEQEYQINDAGSLNIISGAKHPVRAWTKGVEFEGLAVQQVVQAANLPFIHKAVAVMPDSHAGKGCTVGSVIPTVNAIVPAFVGVDIGCGVIASKTSLKATDLPDNLFGIRSAIERAIPHGMTDRGGDNDRGVWGELPKDYHHLWFDNLKEEYDLLCQKHPKVAHRRPDKQLGTLGTGNHFVELCLDKNDAVWIMIHSGSRGVGNKIGTHFIELAKKDMERYFINLPDKNLAYLPEGSDNFDDYVKFVNWSQSYARINREIMMLQAMKALASAKGIPEFTAQVESVNCHHNYISYENHYGKNVYVTRKGAICARKDMMGVILGSMGAKSYIVKGLGNEESFCSCSHGAGRRMSRTEARKRISIEQHISDTAGIECRKDADVIDESPSAYKDIDAVMAAQKDLCEVVNVLRQVVCVKG